MVARGGFEPPRRPYESRVLPTELASQIFSSYRQKLKGPGIAGAFGNLISSFRYEGRTNPEGQTLLLRRLIMDLILINIGRYSLPHIENSVY